VIDAGANTGQFGLSLRHQGYRGRIISFEPVSDTFANLQRTASGDPMWEARHKALGKRPEKSQINVFTDSCYSSLKAPSKRALSFDPHGLRLERIESIEVARCDAEIGARDCKNGLLKIDAQGFEKEILEGSAEILPNIAGILMEIPLINIYENTWDFPEALVYMKSLGYAVSQMTPTNYARGIDESSLLEIDCVFRRVSDMVDET
jgi:FkbM family methyltransferase